MIARHDTTATKHVIGWTWMIKAAISLELRDT